MAKAGTSVLRDDHDSLPLTFDEVARDFSVPIAEAANILGASKLKAKLTLLLMTWVDGSKEFLLQHETWTRSYIWHKTVRQHPHHSSQRASIQTYLDEFKQGFPRNGLSRVLSRWWSSSRSLSAQNASGDSQRNETLSVGGTSDKLEGNEAQNAVQENRKLNSESDGCLKILRSDISKIHGPIRSHGEDLMHVALLSRTRKKNAETGSKALKLAVTNGYGTYKLEEKEKLLLKQVFGSSFPRQWTGSLS